MNTGVGCHFFLQGIFPTQGSNPGLPHCRQTLYCLSYQGDTNTMLWKGRKRTVLAICPSYLILLLWGPPKLEINHLISMDIKIPTQDCWSGLPFLPLGIFLIQRSSPRLLHWQVDYSPLSHLGSPSCPH